jgi:polysaccharide biosynthesis/export protein
MTNRVLKGLILVIAGVVGFPAFSQTVPPSIQNAPSSMPYNPAAPSTANMRNLAAPAALLAVPEDFSKLKIAPGFLLKCDVYDAPELSAELRVDDSGNIAFPLIGTIRAADRTLSQLREEIEALLLSKKILNYPQVTINIEQYAPFFVAVLGEVQSPGRLQLLAPHSLLDIVSQVGGETPMAGGEIEVRHEVDGKVEIKTYKYERTSDGSSIDTVMIHNGDTIIVPRAGIVYVLGSVSRPGGYVMQEGGKLDVAQALSLAMGTTLQASVGSIKVIRRNPDGSWLQLPVDYKAIGAGKQIPLRLQAEDIVYVPISKTKTVLTTGSGIIGEATYATVYGLK